MSTIKVKDSEAYECRWSEYILNDYLECDVIEDNSDNDWQGNVEVTFTDGEKFYYLEYSYGSCCGCDIWETMEEDERNKDIKKCLLILDNKKMYEDWLNRRNKEKNHE